MQAKESRKLAYLKARFADDLETGPKIFVRKGFETIEMVRRLHAALQMHGANWLLWVVPASGDNQPGMVDVLQPGLLRGYVGRYKDFATEQPVDLVDWVTVCRQAYSLFMSARNRRVVFVPNKILCKGTAWTFSPAGTIDQHIDVASMKSEISAARLMLNRDTQGYEPLARRAMTCTVEPRAILVFSAWIWISDRFRGSRVNVAFEAWSELLMQMADLSKRNCWQLIWVSARVPRGVGPVAATLQLAATAGSVVYVSAWQLEHGTVPTPFGRPMGWPRSIVRTVRGAAHRMALRLAGIVAPREVASRMRDVGKGGPAWRMFFAAAEAQMADRRFDEADSVLLRAIAAFPGDRDLLKLYAWSAHVSARHALAIERWRQALDVAPGDPLCQCALAANLREHGLVEAAEMTILAALPSFPDDINIVTEAGRIAQARARYDEALAHWDKALAMAAPHPDWLRCRAAAARALEDQRSARPPPPG